MDRTEKDRCYVMTSRFGLFLVICDDPELASTLTHIQQEMDIRVWVPNKQGQLQSALIDACEDAADTKTLVKGDITKPLFFQQWESYHPICVVLSLKDGDKYNIVRENILRELPEARILSLQIGHPEELPRKLADNDRELMLSWTELLSQPIRAELRHVETTHRVHKLFHVLDDADKIALLLQPDPDPDGIAAALGLRCLLGRNKVSTPIVSFGRVTRPENLAMLKLLDLEVITIKPEELSQYDRVALLDTQPGHFSFPLPRVDAIIDHHPIVGNYGEVPYVDIRSKYGATSTIMTEYLRGLAVNIGQRLATALLYGIKSDTLHLNREVIDSDLYAFMSLYPLINYNLLRRMEKPEIPLKFAHNLAHALNTMENKETVLVSSLGKVSREDLIPQIADFLLQFEGMEWVVCVGLFNDTVIFSVRNVGYVKNAGDVVKRLIAGWGQGGGHRTMAKAIFPVEEWKKRYGALTDANIRSVVLDMFVKEAL
jgi:nanoRNase/pAp phosphatase (c-di-AMP/oligoRNAs hydrolase)